MVTEIIDKVKNDSNIKIISFDIFDTLVFRTVCRPDEVFSRMYQQAPALFPEFTDAEDWKQARKTAEEKAKSRALNETGSREVTIDKIYKELPTVYKNTQDLMDLEVKTEKDSCFLNEEIYSTLCFISAELRLKIVLVSDMYLTKGILIDILRENGADISLFDDVFVSCDYRASKSEGKLFEKVFAHYNLEGQNFLHVGDNYLGDYGTPLKYGMNVYAYNLISEATIKYPFLFVENMAYSSICKEIYSLRLIAANEGKDVNKEKKMFFDIGAMVLGPIFTYATEWVMDEAKKRNIKIIRPFMREGKFLSELLMNSDRERDANISIKPLFTSRLAAFSGMFHKASKKDITYILSVAHLSVHDIFSILNINELEKTFESYSQVCTEDFRNTKFNGKNLYEGLSDYLSQESVLGIIRENNIENASKMYDYLCQEGLNQDSITLDIGWQGNIQNIISRSMMEKEGELHNLHLLVFSGPNVVKNAVSGCDIRGFVGNFGKDRKDIAALSVKLLESFFLCLEGTTVAYERQGNIVVPVVQKIDYSDWQVEAMHEVQNGILSFQRMYFKLAEKKPYIKNWENCEVELCRLAERLFMFPQTNEVEGLAKIQFDQNYGANCFVPVLKESFFNRYRNKGKEFFYSTFRSNEEEWYSGLNVYLNPYHVYDLLLQTNAKYTLYALLLLVKRTCEAMQNEKMVIVGAGENAKTILRFLSAINKLSVVEGIVDSNPKLHGASIAGITIRPVSYHYDTTNYLCSIQNKTVCDLLHQQLIECIESEINFFSYFEED